MIGVDTMSAISPTLQNQQRSGIKEERASKVNARAESILIADDSATIRCSCRSRSFFFVHLADNLLAGADLTSKLLRLPDGIRFNRVAV
jgi:hypothetical protein